jgi:hypothetical protein
MWLDFARQPPLASLSAARNLRGRNLVLPGSYNPRNLRVELGAKQHRRAVGRLEIGD